MATLDLQQAARSGGLTFGNIGPVRDPNVYNAMRMSSGYRGTGPIAPTGGTGGGGGGIPQTSAPIEQTNIPDYEAETRNAINSGYDSYFSELDSLLNTNLPSQQQAQLGIVGSQYDQGVNTLTSQKTLGQQDLNATRQKAETNQGRTLRDLNDNIRNLFTAGNVYLGSRGAGDSSASNQYAYALTKLGSKERGNVTSQYADINNDIDGREFRLNEIFNSQINDLGYERDQKINSIAQWFGEQQNALKMAKAQGQLSRGQDLASLSQQLLNQALQSLSLVQSEAANKRAALDQWAMNNSTNLQGLKGNLAQVSQYNPSMPNAQPIAGMPSLGGGGGIPSFFANNSPEEEKRGFFG